jgi:hypothetical protein
MHAHLALPPTSQSASPRMWRRARLAGVAQLVEHLFCKQVVGGSSPPASSTGSFSPSEGCPSGQREQAVNLPAHAYVGSNPTPSTFLFGVSSAVEVSLQSLGSGPFVVRQASTASRPTRLPARPRRVRRFVVGFGRSSADRDLVFQDFVVDPGAACAAPVATCGVGDLRGSASRGIHRGTCSAGDRKRFASVGTPRGTCSAAGLHGRERLAPASGFATHLNASLFAGVAQLVERQPSKLNVEGSNPFSRSGSSSGNKTGRSDVRDVSRQGLWADRRSDRQEPTTAHLAQLVEHVLGKDEVTSSNLVVGSNRSVAPSEGLNNPKGVGR